jgi:hypothetical protein
MDAECTFEEIMKKEDVVWKCMKGMLNGEI